MAALMPAKPPPSMTTRLRLPPFRVAAASAIVRAPLFNPAACSSTPPLTGRTPKDKFSLSLLRFPSLLDAPILSWFRRQKLVSRRLRLLFESQREKALRARRRGEIRRLGDSDELLRRYCQQAVRIGDQRVLRRSENRRDGAT